MAQRSIKYDENGFPTRIRTGLGVGTIPFPRDLYCGDPEDFKWPTAMMETQYQILKKAFIRNGLNDVLIGAELVETYDHLKQAKKKSKTRFVLIAGANEQIKFIWQKYESAADGSGQNYIFADGKKIKMSGFIAMTYDQQDEVIEPVELRRILRAQGLV